MMKVIAFLIAISPSTVIAQDAILGLLEIPVLHGVNDGSSNSDRALGTVTLYSEPNVNSDVVAIIGDRRELESREHDYEQVSAVVYGRAGNARTGYYYRLRTADDEGQSGWVWQGDAGIFRGMGTLLSSRGLTYLTDAWDGRLYEVPGNDSRFKSYSDLEGQQDIRIVGVHSRGGVPTWYLVVLVRGSCTGDPLEVIDYGWVPEYQETGGNTLWYCSRGC